MSILKKMHKAGGLKPLDLETYYEATIVNSVRHWQEEG